MALSKEQVFNFVKRPKEEEGGRLSRSTTYYLWYWDNVYSKGRSWSWNWAAAIFGTFWAVYRGAYIVMLFDLLLEAVIFALCGFSLKNFHLYCFSKYSYILSGILLLLSGFFGTRFYFWWMEKQINKGVTSVKPKMWTAIGYVFLVLSLYINLSFKFSEDANVKKSPAIEHPSPSDS